MDKKGPTNQKPKDPSWSLSLGGIDFEAVSVQVGF